jgi:putative DNA primase/helicase
MSAVNRVLEPGCKADHMLILEGNQGIGKSTALIELATIDGVNYHTDDAKDIGDKDTLMIMHTKLIVELA